MSLTIVVPPGTQAYIEESDDIPEHIHRAITDHLSHVNPLNLNEVIKGYENGVIYRGCVREVKRQLKSFGYESNIQFKTIRKQYEWKTNLTPRDWQEEALPIAIRLKGGIIQATPGAGKTNFAAMLIADLGVRTLFLTQNDEPYSQALAAFKKAGLGDYVGSVKASRRVFKPITVAMAQSLHAAVRSRNDDVIRELRKFRLIITDEAHNIGPGDRYSMIVDEMTGILYSYGLTATPFRHDGIDIVMKSVCGDVIYKLSYGDAIESDYLVPITVVVDKKVVGKDYKLQGLKRYSRTQKGKDYDAVYTDFVIYGNTGRNNRIAKRVKYHQARNRTVAIIITRIEHGKELQRLIPNALLLHGKTPKDERALIIDQLRHREITCVITTLFNEAADIPSLDVVSLAAAGKSEKSLIQRLRNTRVSTKKLRTGLYVKKRGYVEIPYDDCDFLKTHSETNVKNLYIMFPKSYTFHYKKHKNIDWLINLITSNCGLNSLHLEGSIPLDIMFTIHRAVL